jgi:Galactose oxidase, central domain
VRLLPLLALLGSGCGARAVVDCSTLALVNPTARGEAGGVWDEARRRLVLFGGDQGVPQQCMPNTDFVGDTWAFWTDCEAFQDLQTDPSPPARGRQATALDPSRDRMILHGGRYRAGTSGAYTLYDDTWALDLATDTWSELSTDGPGARTNHVAVVRGDQLVIYGGNSSTSGLSFTPLGDVWSLDLTTDTWTRETTTGTAPRPRLFHAAALSDDGRTMYVYGGGGANAFQGPFYKDLWALDLDTWAWTSLDDGTESGAPRGRIWANLVFDGPRNRLVLWAGHDDGPLGNTNELWSWDLTTRTWTEIAAGDQLDQGGAGFCNFPSNFVTPDLASPERRDAGVAAITGDERLVIFGGKSDCGLLDDVWSYPLAGGPWSNDARATTGEICQRSQQECQSLCY